MRNPGLEKLLSINFTLPPLPTQQKIADILGAYDELIENNRRRIALLENMAAGLYKEWFVRMRPHGQTLPKSVETGLPEGWEVKKLGEVVEILGGGTPSTEVPEYWENGTINWFSPTDITAAKGIFLDSSKNKITDKGLKNSSTKIFPPFSVMMTSRATVGEVGINTTEACTNQGFIVCLPNKKVSYPYLYFWIKENKETIISLSTGATFAEMSRGTFKKLDFILPNEVLMNQFNQFITPIFNQIKTLQEQTGVLRRVRDRLLPRLMSGELGG